MTPNPIELRRWTYANERARREYRAMPTACAHWCPVCVWPIEKRRCEHCKAVMQERREGKKP